ncbi:unnamed protein product [Leuciscus chuanchicus]
MPAVLNLSNEVVKMRPEVKRVKVLLIRKLARQISALEKKKGNEADVEKFRRRAARLREEIHELKVVVPDSVTKAALQKDISFDKVCRNKEASLSERASARIATHPQFSKRIQNIKAAIKAFKDERINARKAQKQGKDHAESVTSQYQPQADDDDDGSEKSNDDGSEKSNDDNEKLTEEEGDKNTDEQQEGIDGSSQESQKTSLETLKEQTNLCQKEETLTVEDSSETVAVPMEVIRMRKEVKRTRVLIISKMAEQVAALKKKKGQETEEKESQERAAGILKEIQALRSLKPDQVTMMALQENAELEKILQDPQASPLDRAIARIITHSRFVNKLQKVKEAIEEERAKAAKAEQRNTDRRDLLQSKNEDKEPEDDDSNDIKEDGDVVEEKSKSFSTEFNKSGVVEPTESKDPDAFELPPSKIITTSSENSIGVEVNSENAEAMAPNVQSSPEKTSTVSSTKSTPPKNVSKAVEEKLKSFSTEINKSGVVEPTENKDPDAFELPPSNIITTPSENSRGVEVNSQNAEAMAPNVQSSPEKTSTVSSTKSTPPKNVDKADKEMEITLMSQNKQDLPETKRLEADEESDLSDDEEEEEKEYFDDSTEERFHKQSSQSEDSEDDDFFLGKVSKFKKRKSNHGKVEEKKSELEKPDKEATSKPHETNLDKLKSVFCSSLSKSTISSQKAKYGSPSHNDGSIPPRFQNQRKGLESRMKTSQYKGQDHGADRRMVPFKPNRQTFKDPGQRQAGPSGAGRGRSQFEQYQNQNPRGPPGNMSNPPQQSLHPSWEASRKRKEQQAQITVFQGKKIRFDDDD